MKLVNIYENKAYFIYVKNQTTFILYIFSHFASFYALIV